MQDVSEKLLDLIALRLRAMGSPIRLKILHALEDGERSVGEIAARVNGSQANVSKQLAQLRGAGLVASRREGISVYYRIDDTAVFRICQTVCESLHSGARAEVEDIERGRDAMSSTWS